MADIVSSKVRSRIMAGIHGKDTKPELFVRKALHAKGFRYKLHDENLPGKPDLTFPMYKAAIQVNGCFWHRHKCHLFKWPSTRKEFWRDKISRNAENDQKNIQCMTDIGWRVLVIWECALKGKTKINHNLVIAQVEQWLLTGRKNHVIEGSDN